MRITEKHPGKRYDSKQVSRIVEQASKEVDAWQNRSLAARVYKLLFVDGTNVNVRIIQRVERLALLAVNKRLVPELLRGTAQGLILPLEGVVLCRPETLVRGVGPVIPITVCLAAARLNIPAQAR